MTYAELARILNDIREIKNRLDTIEKMIEQLENTRKTS